MTTERLRTPAETYEEVFVPAVFAPLTEIVVVAADPQPREQVLDLACGTGVVARAVAPLVGAQGSVVGVDVAPGLLAIARSLPAPTGASIAWLEGDAAALDLSDASFDLVICQQGLQFFAQREAALAEIVRVLRPGGRLVAAVWRPIEEQPLMEGLTEIEIRHLGPLGLEREDAVAPFLWGDPEVIGAALEAAGLTHLSIETRTIGTSFPATTFVADVEAAYAGLFPAFLADPAAHARFVAAVERDAGPLAERFRDGDRLQAPMATNLVLARRPA